MSRHFSTGTNSPAPFPKNQRIRQEKGTQTQTFCPDIFWWRGGLSREGVGGQKVRYVPLNTCKPNFLADIPGAPEKLEKKSLCSLLGPYLEVFLEIT